MALGPRNPGASGHQGIPDVFWLKSTTGTSWVVVHVQMMGDFILESYNVEQTVEWLSWLRLTRDYADTIRGWSSRPFRIRRRRLDTVWY